MRTLADVRLTGFRAELSTEDLRLERCFFDNASIRGGRLRGIIAVDCVAWASSLEDVVVEDCTVERLRMSQGAGRRMPLFLWGGMASRLLLRGRIGSVIWNPPKSNPRGRRSRSWEDAREYYSEVDWALDISEARFTSIPSLRFGPPGNLIRRDPTTQPLVHRERIVDRSWEALGPDLGVWTVVLDGFLRRPWPDEIVLVPARGGTKAAYEQDLAGIRTLEQAGFTES